MQVASTASLATRVITNYCRRLALKHRELKTCHCLCATKSFSMAAAIEPPHVEGTERSYPPKIQKLVQDISQLSLLEVADLNELLKKTLNIRDAPVMAMGTTVAPAVKQDDDDEVAAPAKEKTLFAVKLVRFEEAKKVQLIKEIKNLIPGINLVQAKKFVESIPQVIKADVGKEEAEKLKEAVAAAGGIAEFE